MKRIGSVVLLGTACVALLVAPAAGAHTLTKKRARAALEPVLAQVTPTVAPAIAAKFPGATISGSEVGPCEILKKGHRAECLLSFDIQGAPTGETFCALDARVDFKSKRSKQLKTSTGSVLVCFFPIPLQ